MTLKFHLFSLLFVPFLLQCASTGTAPSSGGDTVQIAFVGHRNGELEPCGCSMNPEGGLAREMELYKRRDYQGIRATGGVTFIPLPHQFNLKLLSHYRLKAEHLVDGLNRLNTQVLVPSLEDTHLGIATLKKLSEKAKFPFISANLVDKGGKRLFPAHWDVEQGGAKITFIGLSGPVYHRYPAPKEARIVDPLNALNRTLETLEDRENRIVVVISTLSRPAHVEVMEKTQGQVHFYFGGDLIAAENGFFQNTPGSVWSNPANGGRSISLLEVQPKLPIRHLWNPEVSASFAALKKNKTTENTELEKLLKEEKLTKKERKDFSAELAANKKSLERAKTLAVPLDPSYTRYQGQVVTLDKEWEPKESTPMKSLLESYHEAVRSAQIAAGKH